jgi:hypothetical protein
MFKRVADEATEIARGMREVEEAVGLRRRKYYGAFDNDGEYRICVELRRATTRRHSGSRSAASPVGVMRGNV